MNKKISKMSQQLAIKLMFGRKNSFLTVPPTAAVVPLGWRAPTSASYPRLSNVKIFFLSFSKTI